MEHKIIIIGAGLTGLALAFFLQQKGINSLILEKSERIGGAMHSHSENGFIYEEGPNTGVLSNPEVVELFDMLEIKPLLANEKAEKRLIYKNKKWYPLPSGPLSFLKTPLFSLSDKIRIPFEPFRKKGNDPDESIASLTKRRIGQSFLDYAVNPFISGIYAGDPEKLVTRYALPKLYRLEQQFGSFIGGSYKKSKEEKTQREQKASKKVFSSQGGFGSLIKKLEERIGKENIICGAQNITIEKINGGFEVSYIKNEQQNKIKSDKVITTVGAFALQDLLPHISPFEIKVASKLDYAKIIQVAVGINKKALPDKYMSFGGLIPQKENRQILGILFPSFCFPERAPQDSVTLAIYLGGIRHPEYITYSDSKITTLIEEELKDLLNIKTSDIYFLKIYRHEHAIPQYDISMGEHLAAISKIETDNKGLILAGNLRDGIGIADRIKQAYKISENLYWNLKA